MTPRANRCALRRPSPVRTLTQTRTRSRQRLSDNGLFPAELLGIHLVRPVRPGTCRPATPSIGGASNATPWKRRWTRRTPREADRSAAALDARQFHCRHLFRLAVRSESPAAGARERAAVDSVQGKVSGARVRADLDSADELNIRAISRSRRRASRLRCSKDRRSCASWRWRR